MAYRKPRAVCTGCGQPASPNAKLCAACARSRGLGSHTPEMRSKHALCGAKTRGGSTCRLFAGQGTNHKGVGHCKLHGGNTPSQVAQALALQVPQQMLRLGQPVPHLKPSQALLGLLRATGGHIAYLHSEIQALTDLTSPEAQVLLRLYDTERDRLTTIAGTCLRAGLTKAQIEMRDAMLTVLVDGVRRACEAAGFDDAMRHELGRQLKLVATDLAEQYPQADVEDVALWGDVLDGDE